MATVPVVGVDELRFSTAVVQNRTNEPARTDMTKRFGKEALLRGLHWWSTVP